jgi:hypothetical protein
VRGRTLDDILAWDDARLEQVHDFIQWLFPLPERSGFNPDAPLLTAEDRAAFAADEGLRERVRGALRRMLRFYGFELAEDGGPVVRPGERWAERTASWVTPGDHNFLRISRILRSCSLLGLAAEAAAFLEALEALAEARRPVVGPVTLSYWRRAVG